MTERRGAIGIPVLILTTAGVALTSVATGFISISPADVVEVLLGGGKDQHRLVVLQFRLPRALVGLMVGAGLAAAGLVLQGVARNGLAEPGIIGINAGAGFTVILLLYAMNQGDTVRGLASAPPLLLPIAAFVGAASAAFLVFALASKKGSVTPVRLLLVGIAANAAIGAATLVVSMRIDRRLYNFAISWLAGTVSGVGWEEVLAPLPWLLALTPVIVANARVLDVMALGDATATGLGVNVERRRVLLIAAATGISAASVAVAGGIAFVGLLGPHIARRLLGHRHAVAIPAAMLCGAILVAGGDLLARILFEPIELPVGIVVSAMGAPYFLFLLTRLRNV